MNSAQSNKAQNDQPSPEDNEKSDRTPDRTPKILTEVKQVAREHTEAAIETLAAMINDESATSGAGAAARAILGRQDTPRATLARRCHPRGEDGRWAPGTHRESVRGEAPVGPQAVTTLISRQM